jgi:hypothetical protein
MARTRATTPKRRRQRERWGAAAAVALAAIAGLLAAHFATRRAWEGSPGIVPSHTSTSVPFVDPQSIP